MLRPSAAAQRFGVSERTLARWADRGLIGRSQVGNAVWYVASDVDELIASRLTKRTVLPFANGAGQSDQSWRDDPFWAGVEGVRR